VSCSPRRDARSLVVHKTGRKVDRCVAIRRRNWNDSHQGSFPSFSSANSSLALLAEAAGMAIGPKQQDSLGSAGLRQGGACRRRPRAVVEGPWVATEDRGFRKGTQRPPKPGVGRKPLHAGSRREGGGASASTKGRAPRSSSTRQGEGWGDATGLAFRSRPLRSTRRAAGCEPALRTVIGASSSRADSDLPEACGDHCSPANPPDAAGCEA